MSSNQPRATRCVFVGNIPYDATEEQLIQICEEVGPVVSFRLVIDRETGKPKGYGFCEFRDEETALSARRNLQGYEINGRQLRVDFAENEKGGGGVDRNREQGRGGPGLQQQPSYGYDVQKQQQQQQQPPQVTHSGLHNVDSPLDQQPIGYQAASAAASLMAGALGGSQLAMLMSQAQGAGQGNGPAQSNGGADLTNHLATMSKPQLYDVMVQMRTFLEQNQQQARQFLLSNPQFTKALFQAQIMLGMVKPSMQGGSAVLPNQQAQGSLSQQPTSVLNQQLAPQLQSQQPRVSAAAAQSIQQPLQSMSFQGTSNQQHVPFQQGTAISQAQLAMAYQHGPHASNQPVSQQAYQQQIASRMGGDIGGGAMLGNSGMLGVPQSRVPAMSGGLSSMATGIMHPSQASGNLGASMGVAMSGGHLLASGNMGSGMGMSMAGGPLGEASSRIAYARPTAASGDELGSSTSMMPPSYAQRLQQSQLQAQSQAQAQPQLQALELEQQKALLQQVMNLTPEQINSLPIEQRQQVLQLQQALR